MADRECEAPPKTRQWSYPDRSEHPDDDVFIYGPWCKSCGICYSMCPQGVLTADKAGRPVVSKPEACIACYLCEMLCPDLAITVYKERKVRGGPEGAAATRSTEEVQRGRGTEDAEADDD